VHRERRLGNRRARPLVRLEGAEERRVAFELDELELRRSLDRGSRSRPVISSEWARLSRWRRMNWV
jgi:hypothetical protein